MSFLKKFKLDGWTNLFTLLGTSRDKKTQTIYNGRNSIDDSTLISLYRSNGLAKKIIDMPVNEMLREWIYIENDLNNVCLKELKRLNAIVKIGTALKFARLFGGAVIVINLSDFGKLDEKLNINKLEVIESLHVYDRRQLSWTTGDLYLDSSKGNYGEVEYYTINPLTQGTDIQFRVHESKMIVIKGDELPRDAKLENNQWSDSILDSIYTELNNIGTAYSNTSSILQDFVQATLSIEGLQDMIASGEEDFIRTRLELIDMSRSVLNTVLLDSQEKFDKTSSSVSGLAELLDHFQMMMCSVTSIPATKLFGRSPAGMNSTGEGDLNNYYDYIRSQQRDTLQPVLEKLVDLILKQKNFKDKIVDYSIVFNSLEQTNEKEKAEIKEINSRSDINYIGVGVLSPDEVAKSRFSSSIYGNDIILNKELRREFELLDDTPVSEEDS